ncbi:sulfatase family protein [Flavilitoribacter nigricans]|uniref:Sulfatase N-terminal domain-containing protein n=1 Tax=Flavilitoribacter nigricans (strain ATCC 23147 / DSM 23189 / NBRC 102662 / NCIMB 1420 / SS-2) TaxID=1122177 RepID=A0A2D0NC87_FLAN2|nr:arylsulfatase [Flavilitoribacter nigricans]PHN05986.1 hypothetical protein CRP01_13520 [Flavilitoribacter nigricans DSM 23189 = NBRC 102662]
MYRINYSLLLVLLLLTGCTAEEDVSNHPNIVYILADDLGYGDLSFLNADSKIQTPHLDQLAAGGLHFTDAHSGSAVCTPTRYGILTGRYAWRTPLKQGVLWPYDPPLIQGERITVAEMLREQGYATACIGKWHLGWDWPLTGGGYARDSLQGFGFDRAARLRIEASVDFNKPVNNGPLSHGFDYYFGDDVPNFPPYSFIENDRLLAFPDQEKPDSLFGNPGKMSAGWELEAVMPAITERAVSYIDEQSTGDQPFFLYFTLTAPHTPIAPADAFKGSSQAGAYGDYVQQVDWTVGQIMQALQEAGIREETLVIFTSDNGSPAREGVNWSGAVSSVLKYDHHPSYHFRGTKADIWEGGHRVPFIVHWPAKIAAGKHSDQTICHTDFMATCAAITGQSLPERTAEDSYNLLPLLLDPQRQTPIREATVHHSGNGSFAIRKGKWKLILDAGSGGWSDPKNARALEDGLPAVQLYEMDTDFGEQNNVEGDHPEVVQELRALLESYQSSGRSVPVGDHDGK